MGLKIPCRMFATICLTSSMLSERPIPSLQSLNFRSYSFRLKSTENKTLIFDVIRKKFVSLQPEEWVRQHVLHFLLEDKKYPAGWVQVEKTIPLNRMKRRFDIVVYNPDGSIKILVECKAPEQAIRQETFDQIARYNQVLRAEYLIVTNGLDHYFFTVDAQKENYVFLSDIPDFRA